VFKNLTKRVYLILYQSSLSRNTLGMCFILWSLSSNMQFQGVDKINLMISHVITGDFCCIVQSLKIDSPLPIRFFSFTIVGIWILNHLSICLPSSQQPYNERWNNIFYQKKKIKQYKCTFKICIVDWELMWQQRLNPYITISLLQFYLI